MTLKVNDWPYGTPDFVNHRVLSKYIQDVAHKTGVHSKTMYGTRVENVCKDGHIWKVQTSTLKRVKNALQRVECDWVGL